MVAPRAPGSGLGPASAERGEDPVRRFVVHPMMNVARPTRVNDAEPRNSVSRVVGAIPWAAATSPTTSALATPTSTKATPTLVSEPLDHLGAPSDERAAFDEGSSITLPSYQ